MGSPYRKAKALRDANKAFGNAIGMVMCRTCERIVSAGNLVGGLCPPCRIQLRL